MLEKINIMFEDVTGLPPGPLPTTQAGSRRRHRSRSPPPPGPPDPPSPPSSPSPPPPPTPPPPPPSQPSSSTKPPYSTSSSKKPSSSTIPPSSTPSSKKPPSPKRKRSRRLDVSEKTLPLSTLAQKRLRSESDSVRTPSQKRHRKDTFPSDFTDPTRPKYSSEVRVTPFRPLKEPKTSDWNDCVKWTRTSKLEGKFLGRVYVKVADVETDFFKLLLENGKWLTDTVSSITLSTFIKKKLINMFVVSYTITAY